MDFKVRAHIQWNARLIIHSYENRTRYGYFFAVVETCLVYLCAFLFIAGGLLDFP